MRRLAPRPIAAALRSLTDDLAPATTLANVQRRWPEAAGAVVAEEARPVSEREGTLTIACRSAAWAQELELLGPELLERLNGLLAPGSTSPPLRSLRVVVGGVRSALDEPG